MYDGLEIDSKFSGFSIDILNFVDLVHPAKITNNWELKLLGSPITVDPSKVIILSHGWSESLGPNYPVIRTLEKVATQRGWKVVVPDFRATYQYGHNRGMKFMDSVLSSELGRSERVRMIYSEMLCLDPKVFDQLRFSHIQPSTLVLVGHSQGGAASSFACENRVVKAQNIHGLLLVGSENPVCVCP